MGDGIWWEEDKLYYNKEDAIQASFFSLEKLSLTATITSGYNNQIVNTETNLDVYIKFITYPLLLWLNYHHFLMNLLI